MLDKKYLASPSDIRYVYDGGLAGFFCCVYESVYSKQIPADIVIESDIQPSMFCEKYVETDIEKAEKVRNSVKEKISPNALVLIENVFLSCMEQKELAMLRFLLMAYRKGAEVLTMLGHPDVVVLLKAQRHLLHEAHLLTGFVRFSDYDGKLVSTITPKNFILPFIANHFINRFYNEEFMIFDKTHKAALIYQNHKRSIIQLNNMELFETTETEKFYQSLWKQFYKTIAIEERYNPKCRMTNMPKRYWENMTEMKDLL